MARRRIKPEQGWQAVADVSASAAAASGGAEIVPGVTASASIETHPAFATAVRFLLEELADVAPGNSVEVRVPPLGATQCIEGPRHTRGTPPNTVEMSPEVWFALATGRLDWQSALAENSVSASGTRADLSEVLPLVRSIA
ncbi:MAG: hypothetical protein RIS82_281 [Actinomycetota bacterium]